MLKVKNKSITIPGGWRDVCPETNFPFFADSLEQLVDKEKKHLIANKYPVPENLAEIIENRICHMMPEGICISTDAEKNVIGRSRLPVVDIMNTTLRFSNTQRVVSQQEAERRASICSSCPHNAISKICSTCRGINSQLRSMMNGRSTPYDHKLHICDIAGGYCKVMVHYLNISVKDKVQGCWIK